MSRTLVITIDGPAGAGKSTVAARVGRRLGLRYLDTGAMYRAYTWKAMENRVDLTDTAQILDIIRRTSLDLDGRRVRVDGKDASRAIRSARVTANVRYLADPPAVRAQLVREQRDFGRMGLVTEGRDQGSVVFPNADLKIFLDAHPSTRAKRRLKDSRKLGERASLREIEHNLRSRDSRDRRRRVGALKVPRGAVRIDTTDLSIREVVDRIVRLAREDHA